MKKQDYSSPQLKVLTMVTQQTIMVVSNEEDVPTIGSEDLDIDFDHPTPGNPEDAF